MSATRSQRTKKKAWNYEDSAVLCSNCEHFRKGMTRLFDSVPRYFNPVCTLGGFVVSPGGCCDMHSELNKVLDKDLK